MTRPTRLLDQVVFISIIAGMILIPRFANNSRDTNRRAGVERSQVVVKTAANSDAGNLAPRMVDDRGKSNPVLRRDATIERMLKRTPSREQRERQRPARNQLEHARMVEKSLQ